MSTSHQSAELTITNPTLDPSLTSWVESANDPTSEFPIQNLPLCAFVREHDGHAHGHLGTRIGDQILDITMLLESGQFEDDEELAEVLSMPFWNVFAGNPELWHRLRIRLQDFLRSDKNAGQQVRRLRQKAVISATNIEFSPPCSIFNYTDFYASKHHAQNVGAMFRPDNPLLPNYKHVPIGYHGRASSVVISDTPITRPKGQQSPPDTDPTASPTFGPCKMLDYELELGLFVGAPNELGEPIEMALVRDHMLGVCLLNDWSARDMQKWEYQPLGPFLAKNFATTISPYIVTMEALEPFLIAGPERDSTDPQPLEYLRSTDNLGLDVTVEVWLCSAQMREQNLPPVKISTGNFKHMYWTLAQMLVHHASNGCNMQPGDLLGSGTISGPDKSSRGCLLELTFDGHENGKMKPRVPVSLPTGETRTFLADGDEVILRGYCERAGFRKIGLGECRGIILPTN